MMMTKRTVTFYPGPGEDLQEDVWDNILSFSLPRATLCVGESLAYKYTRRGRETTTPRKTHRGNNRASASHEQRLAVARCGHGWRVVR